MINLTDVGVGLTRVDYGTWRHCQSTTVNQSMVLRLSSSTTNHRQAPATETLPWASVS